MENVTVKERMGKEIASQVLCSMCRNAEDPQKKACADCPIRLGMKIGWKPNDVQETLMEFGYDVPAAEIFGEFISGLTREFGREEE